MIKNLNRKEVFFTETEDEALALVDECRGAEDGDKIVGQKIQQKANKNGDYWLVELQFKFNTPAGIMESEADPEGETKSDGKDGDGGAKN